MSSFIRCFQRDYQLLLNYARSSLIKSGLSKMNDLSPEDIVNSVLINAELQAAYNRERYLKMISILVTKEANERRNFLRMDEECLSTSNVNKRSLSVNDQKTCTCCKQEFPVSVFYFNSKRTWRDSWCPTCRRVKNKQHNQRQRELLNSRYARNLLNQANRKNKADAAMDIDLVAIIRKKLDLMDARMKRIESAFNR